MKKSIRGLLILTISIVLVLAVLVAGGVFPITSVWAQVGAAVLSVMLTVFLTSSLLNNQTDVELEREKNAKVYEEKLSIYKDFLNKLCTTLNDEKFNSKEALELEFQMALIAMHTDDKQVEKISKSVSNIAKLYTPNGQNQAPEKRCDELLKNLFDLRKHFREALYPAEEATQMFNQESIDTALEQIAEFDELAHSESKNPIYIIPNKENSKSSGWMGRMVKNAINSVLVQDNIATNEPAKDNWKETIETQPLPSRKYTYKSEGVTMLECGIELGNNGNYFWGRVNESYFDRRAFYSALKHILGGYFSKDDRWYLNVNEKYQNTDPVQKDKDKDFDSYISKELSQIKQCMLEYSESHKG